ncbi:Uncharacterised protein [Mycobacteroides abscessus]|nr:Uncharacterised protein [Mycobacteroides abscessus]
MDLGDQRADVVADDTHHRQRQRIHHRHIQSALAGHRGSLDTKDTRTDDHQRSATVQIGSQPQRIVEIAQHVHSLDTATAGKPPRRHSRRDDQGVVVDPLAVIEVYGARGSVHRGRPYALAQV